MLIKDILADKPEHAAFIRCRPLEIRPACLHPNMGKCYLATHGKDFSGNAKSTGSVCAWTHGVGLWGWCCTGEAEASTPTSKLSIILYSHAVNPKPNGKMPFFMAYVYSKRSRC